MIENKSNVVIGTLATTTAVLLLVLASKSLVPHECEYQTYVPRYYDRPLDYYPFLTAFSHNRVKFAGYLMYDKVEGNETKTVFLDLKPTEYSEIDSDTMGQHKELGTNCANIGFSAANNQGFMLMQYRLPNQSLVFCEAPVPEITSVDEFSSENEIQITCRSKIGKIYLIIKKLQFTSASNVAPPKQPQNDVVPSNNSITI